MDILNVTKDTFDAEVLKSPLPVLADFWATWCGPCRMLSPLVDEVAEENAGRIKTVKINVDEEGELAIRYGVASIPTLILFRDGQAAKKSIGYMPKEEIEAFIG